MRAGLKEKYLQAIIGVNKDRDYSILEYQALHPDATYLEIKQFLALKMTDDRVGAIVTTNWDIVLKIFASENYLYAPEGRAFERAKAYFRKDKKGIETRKDPLDILNDMEDKTVKVDQSVHNHKTFIYLDKKAVEENAASNRVASQLSTEQV